MTADVSNLTREDWKKIKKWFTEIKNFPYACPQFSCKRCKDVFPDLPLRDSYNPQYKYLCPCNHYEAEYVLKVVEEILKDREENNGQ